MYPDHLYELHKDQPLAPENLKITEQMLPDHVLKTLRVNGKKFSEQIRLCPNFFDKERYVVHIANLKFYLEQGLVLKKIHRAISFYQSAWLKPYITLNTRKRMAATSEFERSFFKLLINSVYGKLVSKNTIIHYLFIHLWYLISIYFISLFYFRCLENVRRYKDVRIISTEKFASKYTARCQYKFFTIIDKDLVCLELQKEKVMLCKPVSVGMVSD